MSLDAIRVVLVEPAGALNVGSVARVMKNMGLSRLVLVNPQCDPLGEEARRMAVHGVDVLEGARSLTSLPEALIGCHRAIATTGRERHLPVPLELPREVLPWLLGEGINSALIFGREDRGLTNEEMNYAQRFLGIPANPVYPSLNLAQAVAVCAYELYQLTVDLSSPKLSLQGDLVPLEVLEGYYEHLERLLLEIGYLHPHTAKARLEKFRQLYNRSGLSGEEVALLRGILRQVEWALRSRGNPP